MFNAGLYGMSTFEQNAGALIQQRYHPSTSNLFHASHLSNLLLQMLYDGIILRLVLHNIVPVLGAGADREKKPSGKCFSCSRMWARLWCWVGMGGRGGKSNAEMKRWNRGAITKPLSFCVTPSAPPVAHSCIPPTLCIFRRSLGWICILQKTLNTAWYWGFTYNSVSCFLSHSICHL